MNTSETKEICATEREEIAREKRAIWNLFTGEEKKKNRLHAASQQAIKDTCMLNGNR